MSGLAKLQYLSILTIIFLVMAFNGHKDDDALVIDEFGLVIIPIY